MTEDLSITEARDQLTSLPKRLAKQHSAVAITRRGKPVLALMPWEFYESIMETLEIMADEDLIKQLRQGIKEVQQGKTIPWEQVKRDLKAFIVSHKS